MYVCIYIFYFTFSWALPLGCRILISLTGILWCPVALTNAQLPQTHADTQRPPSHLHPAGLLRTTGELLDQPPRLRGERPAPALCRHDRETFRTRSWAAYLGGQLSPSHLFCCVKKKHGSLLKAFHSPLWKKNKKVPVFSFNSLYMRSVKWKREFYFYWSLGGKFSVSTLSVPARENKESAEKIKPFSAFRGHKRALSAPSQSCLLWPWLLARIYKSRNIPWPTVHHRETLENSTLFSASRKHPFSVVLRKNEI